MKLRVLSLFAGIGGFDLGLERTGGFETVAFCEIDPFCRRVLSKHWPNVRQYHDVRDLTADTLRRDGIAVDVICGGFPCQDISTAGKQAGMESNTRSGLWSEIARLASEIRPQYILVENVSNLLGGPSGQPGKWFGRVLGDLAEIGFDAEWHGIPASALGAPHPRDRVWIIAYPTGRHKHDSLIRRRDIVRDCEKALWGTFDSASARMVDGVSNRPHRLRALGNAVVPQIPELIGRAILEASREAA